MMARENPKDILCDLCEEEQATTYCDKCQSKVCETCKQSHVKQKKTKDHHLVDIDEVTLSVLKVSCSLCDDHARKFCSDCNDRLCTACAESHHKLDIYTVDDKAEKTRDSSQILNKDSTQASIAISGTTDVQNQPNDLCDLCEDESAVIFCEECQCKLGDVCKQSHKKQKATRNHNITPIQFAKLNTLNSKCSICDGRAETFCNYCDVHLCTKCSNDHHKLSETLTSRKKITNTNQDFVKPFNESKTHTDESNIFKSGASTDKKSMGTLSVDPLNGQPTEGGKPGQPSVEKVYTDSVDIVWAGLDNLCEGDVYQVRTENIIQTSKWHDQNFKVNNGKITGLEPDASYVFKVRVVKANGEESRYSDKSEEVTTHRAYASELVRKLSPVEANRNGPDIYALPMHKTKEGRVYKAMTKKYEIGSRTKQDNEKTIMFVGATGTGKSTLVDGLTNYIMGVKLDDPFRFTLMAEENKEKKNDQALSQTDWITTYSFNPELGTRLSYRLNVIDTPGFGDTRGLERDHMIVDQIRHLFEATGETGVQTIDAVCFLIKAPDSRLTATQKYIFNAIMSLFGKDIEKNICTLITFADGSDPPVLSAVNASGLPFGRTFTFNNSALFSNPSNHFTSMFWEMGLQSFEAVFNHITLLETKSIQLTKEVLQERHRLEVTISNLQLSIKEGLATTERLNSEVTLFQNNQEEIKRNAQFTYEVTETQIIKVDLRPGIHVTNCLPCNRTCHAECGIPDDAQKRGCWAMGRDGYCQQCPNKCYWDLHKNAPFKLDLVTKKVQKTYEDMKKKYEDASGKLMSLEQVLDEMEEELEAITLVIENMVDDMRKCNNRLKEISLRPNPLGMVEQIDLLIQAEKYERKPGYLGRIEVLQQFLDRANIGGSVDKFRQQKVSVKTSLNEYVDSRKKKGFFSIFSK